MNEHDIASASLSRVDCQWCGGRLYTQHKPDCPVLAAQKERLDSLVETMTAALPRLRPMNSGGGAS